MKDAWLLFAELCLRDPEGISEQAFEILCQMVGEIKPHPKWWVRIEATDGRYYLPEGV